MSDSEKTPESATELNIEEAILQLEAQLEKVKQRHQQIINDKQRKEELINRKEQLKTLKTENNPPDSLKSELKYIEEELNEIEVRLESELFKWSSLSEPFWQIVRFGGIGIIIGWILKTMTIN
ncbi:hypothetical protein WEU38_12800 [Cyanobacterium aponinum AL20118]|uniref:DUF2203 domain-containing protein n=1 Tax=Cyanobacterium aponinum AL20115 TaxID=3090662 RepID=A0AAF1C4W4_9CHRO|nr:hypothetical protein [Cyanobacterium aponinum]WPF87685.1 hypothetical protein SAY89_12865 [Cyanobacterium aponinum AL20115]